MDALIAKLEKRFSPEFSKLLAKRVLNTPEDLALRAALRTQNNCHELNHRSTSIFVNNGINEHVEQSCHFPKPYPSNR